MLKYGVHPAVACATELILQLSAIQLFANCVAKAMGGDKVGGGDAVHQC